MDLRVLTAICLKQLFKRPILRYSLKLCVREGEIERQFTVCGNSDYFAGGHTEIRKRG